MLFLIILLVRQLLSNYIVQMDLSEQIHQNFKQWFLINGGKYKKIQFPCRFGQTGYIGIKASTQIYSSQVFLAVPKKIIITPSVVKNSKLSQILHLYDLSRKDKEQYEFNILVLFIIWNKMLGKDSFYFPYLQAIQKSCTIRQWSDKDIQLINDPYINVSYINQLKQQQEEHYNEFQTISINHPQLFRQPITLDLYKQGYQIVLTRSFGWGLPQTMMVPFADFLNHDSNGVYHYVLNCELQKNSKTTKFCDQYITKSGELDLSLLGIYSQKKQENAQLQNKRQNLLKQNKNEKQQTYNYFEAKKIISSIHNQNLAKGYNVELMPSSDSEDNDSSQSDQQVLDQRKLHVREIIQKARDEKQQKFQQNKPGANRQFSKDITFFWWEITNPQQTYFIVAAHRNIAKNEQVFNSYGRRSNRFLLIWYGFTHENNKYDSLSFRFWNYEIFKNTGNLIFARYITTKDHLQKIKIGNERYGVDCLSDQFRLKKNVLSYQLMAFLRLRLLEKKQFQKEKFKNIEKNAFKTQSIQFEQFMLRQYFFVLKHVTRVYELDKEKQESENQQINCFKKILFKSYSQILQNHLRGVMILQNLLQKLQSNSNLLEVYHSSLYQNEKEGPQDKIKENKVENRKLTLDYFKILSKNGIY